MKSKILVFYKYYELSGSDKAKGELHEVHVIFARNSLKIAALGLRKFFELRTPIFVFILRMLYTFLLSHIRKAQKLLKTQ